MSVERHQHEDGEHLLRYDTEVKPHIITTSSMGGRVFTMKPSSGISFCCTARAGNALVVPQVMPPLIESTCAVR
jgi:hypothetical protein